MGSQKSPRLPQLDALRALAIFLVLGRHFTELPPGGHSFAEDAVRWFLLVWHRCGWIGVDLFFVLSGYLISGLLFHEFQQKQRVNVGRFLIRRGLKIYPAFFALFTFTCLLRLHTHKFSGRQALIEALFVQNYWLGQWLHTWSLAIEEHFYLAAAIGIAILGRRGGRNPFRHVPVYFAVLAVVCLALRIVTSLRHPVFDFFPQMCPTHLRADSLMFGVLLCYLDNFHRTKFRTLLSRHRVLIAISSIVLISPPLIVEIDYTHQFYMPALAPISLYLGFGGILMLSLNSSRAARSRLLMAIGRIGFYSYSIYLWHIACRQFAAAKIPADHFWRLWLAYNLGSIIVGIVMARLVEIPVLYLRDRFFPSRTNAVDSIRSENQIPDPGIIESTPQVGRVESLLAE